MKSAHRHELQQNDLAHRLEAFIERSKPYLGKVTTAIVALIAALFLWSYISGSSASRRSEAWDTYNQAIGAEPPSLDKLHQAAAQNPGTSMQRMADVTWADGQVMLAANSYFINRSAADEALNRAASAYQSVLQSTSDGRLAGRAHLGLARVYEMQNDLKKAQAEYKQVTGPFASYAKQQAERLAKPEAKETYDWLASAPPPKPKTPLGPGTPGERPDFSPGDISLPNASPPTSSTPAESKSAADTFESLFKDTEKESKGETGDRYKADQPAPGSTPAPSSDATTPADKKNSEPPAKSETPKSDATPAAPADKKAAK